MWKKKTLHVQKVYLFNVYLCGILLWGNIHFLYDHMDLTHIWLYESLELGLFVDYCKALVGKNTCW